MFFISGEFLPLKIIPEDYADSFRCRFPIVFFLINAIITLTTEYWCLQGRVKFPTGGKVRERENAGTC